jgi:MoxR-like ATPase
MANWMVYSGSGKPHDDVKRLPPPPPWRVFRGGPPDDATVEFRDGELHQATTYQPDPETVELVNASLYLRRPLLVTGRPGTGKSTLAYAIAHELQLGPVLHWPITSRVTLRDGLYQYDPLTRLYAASRRDAASRRATDDMVDTNDREEDIGRYLRLGPLGTALLPYERPRVLLIDEIDKSDLDLPNDLLTIFEKGEYDIPELTRIADSQPECDVRVAGGTDRVTIVGGAVYCRAFPMVVMTSNGEREFPPAFLRRCVNVRLRDPDLTQLTKIVQAHLGKQLANDGADLITHFLDRKTSGELATDQLLNALYLVHHAARAGAINRTALADQVLPYLSARQELATLVESDDD